MEELKECQGRIRVGSLPWEVAERLAQFRGNWLEFTSEDNAILFRRVQPLGCPPFTGVPCELILLIDSIPPEFRELMPGGELSLKDLQGRVLRLAVKRGEIRIQWPQEACYRRVSGPAERIGEGCGRVNGWARFAGSSSRSQELRAFVDRFGGLYPEEDMPTECEQNVVYVRFRNASIEPEELLYELRDLADPPESLQAELEIEPSGSRPGEASSRIQVVDGHTEGAAAALPKCSP